MKTFLKLLLYAIISIILIAGLSIGGVYWKYTSVTNQVPQSTPEEIVSAYPLSAKVNPFIGTGGIPWTCAYNFPGASLPFGVVRLSPETSAIFTGEKALNSSGYFYGDDKIIGFSHTRLVGTGATDGGHFLVMPSDGLELFHEKEWQYKFRHADEMAYPGYYSLKFPQKGIKVELTSTQRVGVHRYTFDPGLQPTILLDITHALGDRRAEDGYIQIDTLNNQVAGHVRTFGSFAGRYGGIKVYFVATFSKTLEAHSILENGQISSANSANGNSIKAAFSFAAAQKPEEIVMKLAISHISIDNARENLALEAAQKTFDDVSREALSAWENRLKSIEIQGGSSVEQVNFYTALYRSFQMPTIFNDANGEYMGFDKAVHHADSFQYYTDMSIWDTFRTTHPLYNLIAPDNQRDMIRSLICMAQQGGWLPRWPSGYGYTNSMLGSAADIVISEAWQKGIREYDIDFAYENMKTIALASTPEGAAFSGRDGNDLCIKYGYCPADSMEEAVSRSLEFAWSDYAISKLATQLGRTEDAEYFYQKSMLYKNTWNPETQYFHPKNADGNFSKDFKPLLLTYLDGDETYTNDYVEGSALQWRWAPFFDAKGLTALFSSKEYFTDELSAFFEKTDPAVGKWNPGSYYWHGNEPDIHSAYLFNTVNRPDLTQKWVRWILDNKYTNRYDGLDGNDDGGTLSAWYVFSAMGIYPVAGTDVYQLGAPLFEKMVVQLQGSPLEILAENYAPDHIYAKRIRLNGRVLDRTWISHDEIINGGTLIFEMSPNP
ncbi:MAG: GH92 family glycosyl hydrolase [Cyclobacteriaceae bacterium]|nr:GH92 family glycosyl hydrolase [Cyclobacteriaceae bacterium]